MINSSNNKRIAKNTLMLYIRMLLSIVVSLYTSRVVLQTLGVDDFGIYGIVGGVVAMFSFLNASMSGATSRFITFALGKGNMKDVNETFSTALIIHIGIALAIVLLAETVGLWFLEEKLVIPEERMFAARIVYQFSILAMAVQVTQVPYNASIISYEKMDVYAYVELLNVFLKLGIVYLLMIGTLDKLILYAVLVFSVNTVVALTYRIYCMRHFETCRFHWVIQKEKLIPMLSFSSWDLYGNMCYSLRQQGINMLINIFFGVTYNAASSVASSVQSSVLSLSANVVQAFRPQIIKQYAHGNYVEMEKLMCNSTKYSLLLFLMLCVPLSYVMYPVMELWLGMVPEFAPEFCMILLLISLFNLINSVLCTAIHATGNIKALSFFAGTIYLTTIPIVYILFKFFVDNSLYAYFASFGAMVFVVICNTILVKKSISQFSILKYVGNVGLAFLLAIISLPVLYVVNYVESGISSIITSFAVYIPTLSVVTYLIGIDKQTRHKLNGFIVSKTHKLK